VLFGVGATPLRAHPVENAVVGETPHPTLFESAAAQVGGIVEAPPADVHGSAEYRRHLATVLTRRGLAEAARRAGARR
jgi:carbon-monoxide dehydrogenase medium subunit